MTLTEFLLARIAEDEAKAQAAAGMTAVRLDSPPTTRVRTSSGAVLFDSDARQDALNVMDAWNHLWNWNPARVLAECEAKRAIVDLHQATSHTSWWGNDDPGPDRLGCVTCGTSGEYAVAWPCQTLRILALPYADHPDFLFPAFYWAP